MKKIVIISALLLSLTTASFAQEKNWTLEMCMEYAIQHSPAVKIKKYETSNYQADYISSIGAFLPGISANVNAEYNMGRTIDYATNQYANDNAFGNYYNLSGELPLFRGGQLIHQWKQAKSNRLLGKSAENIAKDQLAMDVMQAYLDVVFYRGMVKFASEKLQESEQTYRQTARMEELGMKSRADLAQIEAQLAGDDYILTQQQNLYNTALLTLKELMNYPYEDELMVEEIIDKTTYIAEMESMEAVFDYASLHNPLALKAHYDLKNSQYQHKINKGKFFPSISFYGGINTYYMSFSDSEKNSVSFQDQLSNYRTDYIGVRLSIPLFSNLNKFADLRKSRNNMRIAEEQKTETLRQLQTSIEKNILDREGYTKEIIQLDKQVKANEIAYQLTVRKFEEGLMSSIDVQTSGAILLQSKANLLQRQLFFIIKDKMVNYYKGIPLVENN